MLSYSTLFAGRDGADDRRAEAQIGSIEELRPDVFLMQEARGIDALRARHRTRYQADDLRGADLPTVPTAGHPNTAFAVMRRDYVLASRALAATAASHQVIRNPVTDRASDHYPVLARFEVR